MDHLISINLRTLAKNNTRQEITRLRFLIVFHVIFDIQASLKQICIDQYYKTLDVALTISFVVFMSIRG